MIKIEKNGISNHPSRTIDSVKRARKNQKIMFFDGSLPIHCPFWFLLPEIQDGSPDEATSARVRSSSIKTRIPAIRLKLAEQTAGITIVTAGESGPSVGVIC
jgi:hypothetical protein